MRELKVLLHDPSLLFVVIAIFSLLGLFIVYPLVRVFWMSLFYQGEFNPKYFLQFFHHHYLFKPFFNSLTVGALVSLIGTFIGFLFAYAVSRTDIPGKPFFRLVATFPIISPPFLIALAAILLLGNHGLITDILKQRFGIHWDIYGLPGLVLTETLAYFPLAFMTLEGVLASIDPALEESALDLGASKLRTFLRVTLPLATPGIASALLLVFIRSLEDFGNPIVIQGHYPVLTTQAYLAVTGMYNLPLGATLAMVLLVPTVLAFILQRYWVSKRSYVTVTGRPSAAGLRSTEPVVKWSLFGVLVLLSGIILLFYGMVLYGSFTKLWGVDNSLTLDNYRYVFSTGLTYLISTLKIAGAATPIGGILAVIIAYLVARKRFPGRWLMDFLSMLNFAIPGTIVGLGYALAFSKPPLQLSGTALIIALVFIFRRMPVGIRDAVAMLQQIDPAIDEAAVDLGGGFLKSFRRVILPLISPAFISGMVYIFVRCVTAISAVVFVVSAKWQLITVALLHEVDNADLAQAAAYGMVIVMVVLGVILLLDNILGKLILRRWQRVS
ncbi:MAG TPA: iron ABC transporter permease [Candidatus Acetothermia bacterium]|nr:iron ABC transporter permease [Candidatus Acetothermia bacterium]